tara:strand:- start:573 stop:2342 length:1770 start_codon:yes stop_codon:yes gene_type:complete
MSEGNLKGEFKKAMNNELDLGEQFEKLDDSLKAVEVEAQRTEMGWDGMTFEEKKNNGLLSTKLKENLKKVAESDARTLRETDELLGPTKKEPFNMQSLEDARKSETIQPKDKEVTPEKKRPWKVFSLPHGYKRMKPRYGQLVPEFESDLDMVAYIIRDGKKASAREPEILQILKDFELTKAEVKAHGRKVHQKLKDMVKEKTGSASASYDNTIDLEITVPNMDFRGRSDGRVRGSSFPPDVDFTDGMYPGDDAMRNYYRRIQEREAVREADYLAEWGAKIADSDMGRLAQSQELAGEAIQAIRAAAITSGVMPERIRWIDEVDMTKLFGEEEHIGAVRNWSPLGATFMARNPGDPLNKTAAGLTTGVYISQTFEKPIRGSIALALHPSIDQRFGGALRRLPSIGRRFYTLAEHEAFHGVQEFLHLSGDKKLIAALKTPQAIEEMKEIIRKSRGNVQADMDIMEIQAEAFGNWANNRNLKLKDGGLKASFEKIKKFLNGVRAKVRKILKKDPTYIDIFEMAHSGELARKKMLNTLSPAQLDAYAKRIDRTTHEQLPELTERIHDYLTAKKVEYDTLINGWELDAASGGCL